MMKIVPLFCCQNLGNTKKSENHQDLILKFNNRLIRHLKSLMISYLFFAESFRICFNLSWTC